MLAYYFTTAEYGLKGIRERRLKIARIRELNDPFELLAPELSDKKKRAGLKKWKENQDRQYGLLCFCRSWHNPVLWGHYAEKHKGICLGFEVQPNKLKRVRYVTTRAPWPDQLDEAFTSDLISTKFVRWSYEEEYRLYLRLESNEADLYFENFGKKMVLKRVIVGSQFPLSRAKIDDALGNLRSWPEIGGTGSQQ